MLANAISGDNGPPPAQRKGRKQVPNGTTCQAKPISIIEMGK